MDFKELQNKVVKKIIPGSTSRLTIVDHNETYGRHILEKVVKAVKITKCVGIGCGSGDDLSLVKQCHPEAELFGIDFGLWNGKKLKSLGIKQIPINIEKDKLPFEDESVDFIIANQVLEHTKEIFWINHEIFRYLKVNGLFFMGVPNVLSLHNRLLMALGWHPTSNKLISAHVPRFFQKRCGPLLPQPRRFLLPIRAIPWFAILPVPESNRQIFVRPFSVIGFH